jgi:hypothetical protein
MTKYFGNAFSINMIKDFPAKITIKKIPDNEYEFFLFKIQNEIQDAETISAIGHEQLAKILNAPVNRITVTLEKDDELCVAQYRGPRLEEGTTSLPDGSKIEFYVVTIE